jgi:hypothetical protein
VLEGGELSLEEGSGEERREEKRRDERKTEKRGEVTERYPNNEMQKERE